MRSTHLTDQTKYLLQFNILENHDMIFHLKRLKIQQVFNDLQIKLNMKSQWIHSSRLKDISCYYQLKRKKVILKLKLNNTKFIVIEKAETNEVKGNNFIS